MMFPQLRRFSREEILHVVETSSKSAKVFLLDFCINRSSLVSRLDGTSKRFERVDFGGKVYIRARYGSLSSLPPSLIFVSLFTSSAHTWRVVRSYYLSLLFLSSFVRRLCYSLFCTRIPQTGRPSASGLRVCRSLPHAPLAQ